MKYCQDKKNRKKKEKKISVAKKEKKKSPQIKKLKPNIYGTHIYKFTK